MEQNQFEGGVRDIAGRAKDAVGSITGDTGLQAEGIADRVAGQAQRKFGDAADAVSDAASRVGDTLSDVGGRVYDAGARAGATIGESVREQPLAALLVVGAIGYGLSYLLHAASSPLAPKPPQPAIRRYLPF